MVPFPVSTETGGSKFSRQCRQQLATSTVSSWCAVSSTVWGMDKDCFSAWGWAWTSLFGCPFFSKTLFPSSRRAKTCVSMYYGWCIQIRSPATVWGRTLICIHCPSTKSHPFHKTGGGFIVYQQMLYQICWPTIKNLKSHPIKICPCTAAWSSHARCRRVSWVVWVSQKSAQIWPRSYLYLWEMWPCTNLSPQTPSWHKGRGTDGLFKLYLISLFLICHSQS